MISKIKYTKYTKNSYSGAVLMLHTVFFIVKSLTKNSFPMLFLS